MIGYAYWGLGLAGLYVWNIAPLVAVIMWAVALLGMRQVSDEEADKWR